MLRRGRDSVNSDMRSISSGAAISQLTYTERISFGAQPLHREGERLQQTLQDRQQVVPGSALCAPHALAPGAHIDGVDVIPPLDSVEVAVMHRVDPHPPRRALCAHLAMPADRVGEECAASRLPRMRVSPGEVQRVRIPSHRER